MWSNTDLQATNTTVEMDYATGGHVTRNSKYINHSDRSQKYSTALHQQLVSYSIFNLVFSII